jgi:hypothetical protein
MLAMTEVAAGIILLARHKRQRFSFRDSQQRERAAEFRPGLTRFPFRADHTRQELRRAYTSALTP